jgi:subtilisin
MKVLLTITTLVLINSQYAGATRFVVKNPKVTPDFMTVVNKIDLGSDQYYILDDNMTAATANSLATASFAAYLGTRLSAEAATPEARIELISPSETAPKGEDGWHVRSLKYDSLPAQYDGRGITVAILDTGVDYTHKDLKKHMWTNTKEIAGNGKDDDNNGYVDDVHGYNFSNKTGSPMDVNSHGTHCAGIVVADAHSSEAGRGVAPGAKIMALKIIGASSILTDAALAIKYAVDNGAKVLSNSWRIYGSWGDNFDVNDANIQLLQDAIKYANARDVIYLAAAGNESVDINDVFKTDTIYPIGYKGIELLVGVASSDSSGNMSDFSSFGLPYVDLAAPGSDIDSTVPGDEWASYSGTSMATPLTAGVLARGLSKGYSAREAVAKLMATSVKTNGFELVNSKGIINVVEYLK